MDFGSREHSESPAVTAFQPPGGPAPWLSFSPLLFSFSSSSSSFLLFACPVSSLYTCTSGTSLYHALIRSNIRPSRSRNVCRSPWHSYQFLDRGFICQGTTAALSSRRVNSISQLLVVLASSIQLPYSIPKLEIPRVPGSSTTTLQATFPDWKDQTREPCRTR